MFSVSSSMPHLGSARLTLRALSIWTSEGGLARRSRNPSRADEDTNACMTSLSMRRSDFNRNPWRTRPGIPSNVSSTDRRLWPGSRKTGLTLWQESRAKAGISRKEFCFNKGADKLIWETGRRLTGGTGKFEGLEASIVITPMPLNGNYDNVTQSVGHKKGTYKIVKTHGAGNVYLQQQLPME